MNNNWLDIELLEDYLDGKLDSKAMHQIEKQALEDPFVAQALAGLSQSPKRAANSVSLLQKQLYERIDQQQVTKKAAVFTWQRLSVGAAAAVMFITVSIIFFMRDAETRKQMDKVRNLPKTVEVNLAPTPSAIDSSKIDNYAVNNTSKNITPVTVGKISPRREANPQPDRSAFVRTNGVMQESVTVPADTTTALEGASAGKSKIALSARVAAVLPAVSTPIGGWANLDSYLADHNKLSKDNKLGKFVELSFSIDSEGHPSDIKVTSGASPEIDEEAVRLIKEGPKWEQPKSADSRVNYTVAF